MLYSLKERFYQEIESEKNVVELLSEGKIASLKNACDGLWYKYEIFGIYNIFIKNFEKTKSYFNTCGLLDIYGVNKYNSRFLDYGFQHVCYAILSDNEEMIQRYAKLRYKTKYIDGRTMKWKDLTMEEMVLDGEGALTCNTIQFFMENNDAGIIRNLNIYELKKKKSYGAQKC